MSLDVQYISLDISKQPTPQHVRLGQGDANATQLVVSVYDEGIAYSLDSYSVRLEMQLPNEGGYYEVDGTRLGNVATFDIDETYAASIYGFDGFGYVDILSGDTVICSTSRFQLVVLKNAGEGVDPSTAYNNGIFEAIDRAIAAAEAAEGVVLQDVPLMSATIRGGAQLGTGLEITDGVLSVDSSTVPIPTMSANVKGGAKLGSGLDVTNDVLSVDITPSDINAANATHTHAASDIASGQVPIANGGTGASTAAAALTALGAASQDDMDDAEQAIADNAAAIATLGESVSLLNLVSATRIAADYTTGSTGNIQTSYSNDGLTAIVAPFSITSGVSTFMRAWVSPYNNNWYLTAVDPNTGATVNNTQLSVRFWVLKFARS